MPLIAHHSILLTTILAILPLFTLLGVGVYARQAKILDHTDASSLTKFVLDITLPALILVTLATQHFSATYLLLPVNMILGQIVAYGAALLIARAFKMNRHSTGSAVFGVFGNTAFIGYPLTTALFPSLLPATVFTDQFGMAIPLYLTSPFIGTKYGEKTDSTTALDRLKKQMRAPLLIGLSIGLILHFVFFYAPQLLAARPTQLGVTALKLIGSATIPVVMVSVGLRLSTGAAKRNLPEIAGIGLIKLIILPFVCYFFGRFIFHLHAPLLSIAVLEAAVPPSVTCTVFAAKYRMNSDLSVAALFVLTIASAITLPVLISVLR